MTQWWSDEIVAGTKPMTDEMAGAIMSRFGKAFFKKDATLLADVLTPDAEWHFAFGPDAPHGRVRRGVDGFLAGARENDSMFEHLRFDQIVCRALGDDRIVMTYLLDGRHRAAEGRGAAFALRGVELISLRDGKIALKDVFWKQHRSA